MVSVTNAIVCIITIPLVASVTIFISMAVYSDYQTKQEDERDTNLNETIQQDVEIDDTDVNWNCDADISQTESLFLTGPGKEQIEAEDHRPSTLRYFDKEVPIIATDLKEYFSSFKR